MLADTEGELGYKGLLSSDNIGGLPDHELFDFMQWLGNAWKSMLRFPMEGFRSGNLLGSKTLFGVMERCSTLWTSCSSPGRVSKFGADWRGVELYAHRTSATSNLDVGGQKCIEIPMSVDTSITITMDDGTIRHLDLTPNIDWKELYGISPATTITNIVERTLNDKPLAAILGFLVHNDVDYSDPKQPKARRLWHNLDEMVRILREYGIEAKGATLPRIADIVRDGTEGS